MVKLKLSRLGLSTPYPLKEMLEENENDLSNSSVEQPVNHVQVNLHVLGLKFYGPNALAFKFLRVVHMLVLLQFQHSVWTSFQLWHPFYSSFVFWLIWLKLFHLVGIVVWTVSNHTFPAVKHWFSPIIFRMHTDFSWNCFFMKWSSNNCYQVSEPSWKPIQQSLLRNLLTTWK